MTSKLCELINLKTITPIPNRSAYDVVVYGSGYRIKKDKKRINIVKSHTISYILNNITIDSKDVFEQISTKDSGKKKISLEIDEKLYKNMSMYTKSMNISNSELLNSFILSLLKNKE